MARPTHLRHLLVVAAVATLVAAAVGAAAPTPTPTLTAGPPDVKYVDAARSRVIAGLIASGIPAGAIVPRPPLCAAIKKTKTVRRACRSTQPPCRPNTRRGGCDATFTVAWDADGSPGRGGGAVVSPPAGGAWFRSNAAVAAAAPQLDAAVAALVAAGVAKEDVRGGMIECKNKLRGLEECAGSPRRAARRWRIRIRISMSITIRFR